eukprot:Nk52_evm32s123 gene=Nk52_evmTU32s123
MSSGYEKFENFENKDQEFGLDGGERCISAPPVLNQFGEIQDRSRTSGASATRGSASSSSSLFAFGFSSPLLNPQSHSMSIEDFDMGSSGEKGNLTHPLESGITSGRSNSYAGGTLGGGVATKPFSPKPQEMRKMSEPYRGINQDGKGGVNSKVVASGSLATVNEKENIASYAATEYGHPVIDSTLYQHKEAPLTRASVDESRVSSIWNPISGFSSMTVSDSTVEQHRHSAPAIRVKDEKFKPNFNENIFYETGQDGNTRTLGSAGAEQAFSSASSSSTVDSAMISQNVNGHGMLSVSSVSHAFSLAYAARMQQYNHAGFNALHSQMAGNYPGDRSEPQSRVSPVDSRLGLEVGEGYRSVGHTSGDNSRSSRAPSPNNSVSDVSPPVHHYARGILGPAGKHSVQKGSEKSHNFSAGFSSKSSASKRVSYSTAFPSANSQSSVVCRYFQQGYCKHGDKCKFLHNGQGSGSSLNVTNTERKNRRGSSRSAPPSPVKSPSPAPLKVHEQFLDPVTPVNTPMNTPLGTPARRSTFRGLESGFPSINRASVDSQSGNDGLRYVSLEQVNGQIYSLCKDQHGCRFLQKKLEDGTPEEIDVIFNEVYDHVAELMTDPFGNYLCQKLVEYCSENQRTSIVERVSPELVFISLNMHGTRAVQKMIECLCNARQIELVVDALRNSVVTLIKDLNGNHVVQRCLQRLKPEENQFIYNAVVGHCIEVATHRHGCCVLQRCIDHASEKQRLQLVNEITANTLVLMQDAFGNYVVQYVLELKNPAYCDALVRRFVGHTHYMATQKFSSNVIEKCLRVSTGETRDMLIDELMNEKWLRRLLQDSYANYVIQTALGVASGEKYDQFVEAIKPFLADIIHMPYGKKIQNKILKESGYGLSSTLQSSPREQSPLFIHGLSEMEIQARMNQQQQLHQMQLQHYPHYNNSVDGRPSGNGNNGTNIGQQQEQ